MTIDLLASGNETTTAALASGLRLLIDDPSPVAEIERELRAQITTARRHLPQVTYTWNHMGFTSLAPEVRDLVGRISKEYELVVPSDLGVQSIGRIYESKDSGAAKAEKP